MRPLISWAHGEADTPPLLPLGVTKSTWAATAEAAPSAARALNATRGLYWTGHKIPAMWVYEVLQWFPVECGLR